MSEQPTQRRLDAALEVVSNVFDQAQQACADWKGPKPAIPTTNITYQEACHIVQRRDDEKRKRDGKHEKNKRKPVPEQTVIPGSRPGIDPEVNAFWMVAEVCSAASERHAYICRCPASKGALMIIYLFNAFLGVNLAFNVFASD